MDYDFKLELAKSIKNCFDNLLKSQQYISKYSIKEMEKVDKLFDKQKITKMQHIQMCEKIKNADKYFLQEQLSLLNDYIFTKQQLTQKHYIFDEIKEKEFDKTLVLILQNTQIIINTFIL